MTAYLISLARICLVAIAVGRTSVNMEVIRFLPRPRISGAAPEFPTIAFRSVAEAGNYADGAPREYVASNTAIDDAESAGRLVDNVLNRGGLICCTLHGLLRRV